MSDFTLTVRARGGRAEAGDCAIVRVEPSWYHDGALLVRRAGAMLSRASEMCAANLGRQLHHADWTITADPAEVERRGIHEPGCAECRAGTDRALLYLAEDPGHEVAVGQMWWVA